MAAGGSAEAVDVPAEAFFPSNCFIKSLRPPNVNLFPGQPSIYSLLKILADSGESFLSSLSFSTSALLAETFFGDGMFSFLKVVRIPLVLNDLTSFFWKS